MKTEKNHRDSRVNAELVNAVTLRQLPPLKKVKPDLEVEKEKKQTKQPKQPKQRKKTVRKPKNVIEPIKKDELKESKQVEEQSTIRNFTVPQAVESKENFELSVPIVVQNVAYVDKKICTPRYPRVSRKRGERGRVLVRVFINRDGSSEKVEIEQSSGFDRLDRAAMDSAKKCRFVPAKRNGKPVKTLATIPYTFTF